MVEEFYVKKWPCLARFFMINFIMSICDHSGNRVVFVMRIFQGHVGIVRFVRGPGAGGGDVKEWAKPFYKSKAWRDCRDAYFIFRHGLCERCGRPGKIVHHKVYLTPQNINDPNVSLNWENLELVCQDCHNLEHHGADVAAEGLMFDGNGDLVRGERSD